MPWKHTVRPAQHSGGWWIIGKMIGRHNPPSNCHYIFSTRQAIIYALSTPEIPRIHHPRGEKCAVFMAYHTHTRLLDLCSHLAKTTAVALAIYLFNRSWFILFLERVFYCSIAGFWDPLCFLSRSILSILGNGSPRATFDCMEDLLPVRHGLATRG